MDFGLDKKHEMARSLFREFAENEVKPLAQEVDETEEFPVETVKKMQKLGFLGIPVPKEFKAEAKKVSYGLAARIWSKKFVICHSKSQAAQMNFSYRHPLYIGKMMTRAAKKVIS